MGVYSSPPSGATRTPCIQYLHHVSHVGIASPDRFSHGHVLSLQFPKIQEKVVARRSDRQDTLGEMLNA
jgi:hypothetical protein